jgi:hypothetical protein
VFDCIAFAQGTNVLVRVDTSKDVLVTVDDVSVEGS